MRKITSFLSLVMLCCISVFAQETVTTELPQNKLVKIGTAQAEMVPGQWYFLHNPRNGQNDDHSYFALPGGTPKRGGFAEDRGTAIGLSTQEVMENATNEEGVSSEEYKTRMVRFVAVEGLEGAYNIQFGTGNWFGDGDPLNTATVNEVKYQAGLAGKWNFYLVKNAEGEPNTAGRFAWNYYDMKNRVDNNGVGNSVNFWNSGELTLEHLDWNQVDEQGDAGIIGNNIWQIYDIQVIGDLDDLFMWNEAFDGLLDNFTTISAYTVSSGELFVIALANGENVGNVPGNYRPEYVEPFLALHNQVSELMDLAEMDGIEAVKELYATPEALDSLNEKYVTAYNTLVQNKVPLAMSTIEPGYYFIKSAAPNFWYKNVNDTTFYTQEEADSLNKLNGAVEGDDYFVAAGDVNEVVARQVFDYDEKAVYTDRDANGTAGSAWGTWEAKPDFLWKVDRFEGDTTGTQYTLYNVGQEVYFVGINQSAATSMTATPTATCFDYRGNDKAPVSGDTITVVNIRNAAHPENGYRYIHAGGHSSGAGTGAWCVGWTDAGATRWYMQSVSEAEVEAILTSPEVLLGRMIVKGDSIAKAFPAQLKIAQDMVAIVHEDDSVVVDASQFYSQYTTNDAQSIPEGQTVYDFLLDGKQSTYWHSAWESGAVSAKVHYLQVEATDVLDGNYAVKLQRRPVSGDHITQLIVKGYVEAPTDETTFDEGTTLATLDLPLTANNETIITEAFDATGMMYLRFYSTTTKAASSGGGANRGYWHASAFNVFKADVNKRYETVQYDARKAEADALIAAVDAWVAGEFSADSVELYNDSTFNANYNALLDAYSAWDAVYVNPNALRSVIAAAPANDLFVVGTNPGEWSADAETPAAAIAAAQAYDESGAYDAETSAAHIAAIEKVVSEVYANANPVEEGVWYNIKFATEEMYDNYGWAKTGAASVIHEASKMEQSMELFGKVVAAGKSVTTYEAYEAEDGSAGEVALYTVETAEEMFEGQSLVFLESDEDAGDASLFRFVAASDSTFMIQNKATGLYVRATYPVTLSAIPSVYEFAAIGAGASTLRAYNVIGGEDNGYNYLHAQRSTNTLTTWDANSLGSNSMMFIEAVEEVTDAPSNEYVQKLWPGQFNAYAMPVDVTVGEGATAYGAQLNVTEEDTTVVLMAIEAETIKAGVPFILVADLDGEYITYADRLAQIKENLKEDLGVEELSSQDNVMAAEIIAEEYAKIGMTHGEVIAAQEVDTLGNLVGTFKNTSIAAGKAIQTKENGFVHTLVDGSIAAYKAWVKADFDANTSDVLKGIEVKIEGSIDTGINEVLNNVAKGGDIYTVGGQLVGKGNINTVNNLPAGIYVVNGVKVIKK